ncbi:hypothetical protein NMY22_g16599 [Coprinellus aureogranulatus]|nr:hypothetical protein NMY22_g16599 [Coprinellus aureogranulatus]
MIRTHSYVEVNHPSPAPRNIVFFGETGVGKSSIINMLLEMSEERFDDAVASVSSAALGCTLVSTKYPCRLGDEMFILWDTAGLVEGEFGNVTGAQAEQNLAELLRSMEGGGVSLLVYCTRARRFRTVIKHHYELFFEKTCERRVPIVLVVNGLENETRMEDWWSRNAWEFETRGIQFTEHACIASTRGKAIPGEKGRAFDEEYEESSLILRGHITSCCAPHNIRITSPKDAASWAAHWKHATQGLKGVPRKLGKMVPEIPGSWIPTPECIVDDKHQPVYVATGVPPRERYFEPAAQCREVYGEGIPMHPMHL